MKIVFLAFNLFTFLFLQAQNVGIGTASPNANAALDIVSSDKALLLPRLNDTAAIATPAAGMVIYNQQTKSPSYHDGSRWNQVNDPSGNFVPLNGSITYAVTGVSVGGIAYQGGETAGIDFSGYSFLPYSSGGGGGGITGVPQKSDSLSFFKEFDGNSIPFKRAHLSGTQIQAIEINQYLSDATLIYSIKLSNVIITSQYTFISEKTGKLTERYGFNGAIVGYKDWINNKSFSYNISTRSFGSY